MSPFWSAWISIITLGVIFGCTALLINIRKSEIYKEATEQTTGHVFDGIEELDNPLPRWWFQLFIGTVIFSVAYLALYPGLGNFNGLLNWTSSNQWKDEVVHANQVYAPLFARYAALPATELLKEENREGLRIGQRLYANNCSVCHGTAATGAYGFPNLTDTDWLYGGSIENIKYTLVNGRVGAMPAWAGVLGESGIRDMASYVLSLSGTEGLDPEAVARATPQFQALCIACHGIEGKGVQALGAPNLTDNTWLYGGRYEQIAHTLRIGRRGKMPAQADLLSEDKINLVAAYVYSLSNKPE
mgnify:CR=1 FL=1